MRRDSLFYQLFAQLSQTLFDLLGIDTPQEYRFDSVELKQTAFRMDGVFVPPETPQEPSIFARFSSSGTIPSRNASLLRFFSTCVCTARPSLIGKPWSFIPIAKLTKRLLSRINC
ncbi:MAG: DUF2887 domain-containing protein [Thermosynechococcus sp.]